MRSHAVAATAALTLSGVASAGNLTPLSWVKDPTVQAQYIQNGKLRDTAPFLGIRTPKPNGGYTAGVCHGLPEPATEHCGLTDVGDRGRILSTRRRWASTRGA